MDATVIVCTYNRADSLRDTLAALQAQEVAPDRQWEIIVVDNNSSDHTRYVVEEVRVSCKRIVYAFEAVQGLSHARNHGIARADGNVILFTDDDVLPEPDWLESTLTGLSKFRADACGGYIAPIWETAPPRWLTERFYGFLAIRNDRADDFLVKPGDTPPFGANMAFRKAVFDKVGLFDGNRGRKGETLASGEDGEMFQRILAAGLVVAFLGSARVHHKIESFRLTKSYLRRWRFQTSRNLAAVRGMPGERRLFNIPLYAFPQLARSVARWLWGYLRLPPDEAFNREMVVFHFLGTFVGLWAARYQ